MKVEFARVLVALLLIVAGTTAPAQKLSDLFADDFDSAYIESYKQELTTRFYTSRKYTNLEMEDQNAGASLRYHPNDRLNLGFGASYRAFTLNIGLNFPFINHDDNLYGKTDYLDLQSHLLFRKFTVEFYLSAFRGYYLSNPETALAHYPDTTIFPQRRDLFSNNLGIVLYYIFNNQKFSYRAAFNQDERQKKSAGSFLFGPAVYTVYAQGDSSLVPRDIYPEDFFTFYRPKSVRYAKALVCLGYAHNFVFKERWFIMLSMIAGTGLGNITLSSDVENNASQSEFNIGFTYTFRAGLGYNSRRFFAGFSYVNTSTSSPTPVDKTNVIFDAGNVRFNVAYRIPLRLGRTK
ncbi:MAG: DUF4421 domain-containing protein [Bacteroidales bacterium]|nr:DUF4421 domain-containing protein [Bacteroidales bacterium]